MHRTGNASASVIPSLPSLVTHTCLLVYLVYPLDMHEHHSPPPPLPQPRRLPGLVHGVSTRHGGVSTWAVCQLEPEHQHGRQPGATWTPTTGGWPQALDVPRERLHHDVAGAWHARGARHGGERGRHDGQGRWHHHRHAWPAADAALRRLHADAGLRPAAPCGRAGRTPAGAARWPAWPTALVQAMADAFGSDPADLVAVIGPAIGPCCYEVGPEVVDAVQHGLSRGAIRC